MSETPRAIETSTISEAANLHVMAFDGSSVRFGSIFESEKVIIVFIRHFFCGNCQQYGSQLAMVRKEALEEANTKMVIVGCGEWQPIKHFAQSTGFQGAIYADPSRTLYRALGMTKGSLAPTPSSQIKKSYLKRGLFANTFHSIWKGPMKNPTLIGKQGSISQLGGDFIFGPGFTCSFASRMQHTEDHLEVGDLMQAAGVAYP